MRTTSGARYQRPARPEGRPVQVGTRVTRSQRQKPTGRGKYWDVAIRILGLSALLAAVNLPLYVDNPSAALITAPADNLAVASLIAGNMRRPQHPDRTRRNE